MAVMGFCNAPAYVQRIMDYYLRKFWEFICIYIDDLVTALKTLNDYEQHLYTLFSTMQELNIALNPKKSFIGFPLVTLLGRRVDAFGMANLEEKMKAVVDLPFPAILKDLEHFLALTGWFR
ncbi:hypothetical protein DTO021C3_6819 [Paecilomyces variotii]|nr:hypothetical protein DTO021C3_6819 [Paecilomyces variotii]